MFNRHPTRGTTAATQGKRKLVSALLAGALMWLPASPAQAVIIDTVTASGTMGSIALSSTATANVDVVDADPKMMIVKSGILNDGSDGSADPGDTITYTFTVTNAGNVTLNDIYLDDPGSVFSTTHLATLAPGAVDTLSFNAIHTLTAPEIVSGNFTNTATFHAKPANGGDITATGIENTPVAVLASMLLEKSGVLNLGTNGRADVNDTITYSFKVTNTGPTPLHTVKISDPLVNLASLPGQDRMVAMLNAEQQPSDSITTASIASAPSFAAADQFGAGLGESNDVPNVAADIAAVRKIVRMSGTTDAVAAGDKIGFVYALNNTGEGPLTTITVHQPGAEAYGNSLDLLAPNASDSANIIFTRAVTAQEVAAGEIIAPARITGKSRNRYLTRDVADRLSLRTITDFDTFATASITPSTVVSLAAGATTTFTAIQFNPSQY